MNRAVIKPVIAITARLVFLWNGNFPSACHRKSPNHKTCRTAAIPSACFLGTPHLHAAVLHVSHALAWQAYIADVRCLRGKPIDHVASVGQTESVQAKTAVSVCACLLCKYRHSYLVMSGYTVPSLCGLSVLFSSLLFSGRLLCTFRL